MVKISIHTPPKGCDRFTHINCFCYIYFNPRSQRDATRHYFQARMPSFNPRSLRGATNQGWKIVPEYGYFNPRSPRGTTCLPRLGCTVSAISIHAPRGARRYTDRKLPFYIRDFNPRSPRGATAILHKVFSIQHPKSHHPSQPQLHIPDVTEKFMQNHNSKSGANPHTFHVRYRFASLRISAYLYPLTSLSLHRDILSFVSVFHSNNKYVYYPSPGQ